MLNVTVDPISLHCFHNQGYYFDFRSEKTTLRNIENVPFFEILYDSATFQNILLTRKKIYYTKNISIGCNIEGTVSLLFKIKEKDKSATIELTIDPYFCEHERYYAET